MSHRFFHRARCTVFPFLLLFGCAATAVNASTAIQIDVGANPLVAFDEELVFGWEFEVLVPIQLHHVGLFDAGSNGFERPWKITIWSLGGGQGTNSVAFGPDTVTESGFTYVETIVQIGPTVHGPTLEPGRYVIAAGGLSFSDADAAVVVDPMPAAATSIIVNPALNFVQARSGRNTFHDEDLVFPGISESGLKYFGPNFQFDVLPQPSAGLLLICGMMICAGRRGRAFAALKCPKSDQIRELAQAKTDGPLTARRGEQPRTTFGGRKLTVFDRLCRGSALHGLHELHSGHRLGVD